MAKSIGIITRAKQFFNKTTLLQLYYSFVYPYLIYGNIIWGNAANVTCWPLYKLQKIAIRLITNTKKGNYTLTQSKELRILRLPDIYIHTVTIFMFKYHHHMLPDSLTTLFIKNNTIHHHNTRISAHLRAPRTHTALAEKFITNSGVKIWNRLKEILNTSQKISTFKQKLTTHLIEKYSD
jgi:hypothetical protein